MRLNGYRLMVLSASLAALAGAPAGADVVYTYTGNDFTTATSPYTQSDHLVIELDFTDALPANLQLSPSSTPFSFAIYDGVHTITDATALGPHTFALATDANGNIVNWGINVLLGPPYVDGMG